jgi:hypothetical protein
VGIVCKDALILAGDSQTSCDDVIHHRLHGCARDRRMLLQVLIAKKPRPKYTVRFKILEEKDLTGFNPMTK